MLSIRIGLHTGEAMRREGGYFGNTVVLARRLCDQAAAGQVLTSGFVASMLAGRQLTFRSLGTGQLKGIAQAVEVVEVGPARRASAGSSDVPSASAAGPAGLTSPVAVAAPEASALASARDTREVFVSYSSRDEAAARELRAFLVAAGVRCWMAPVDVQGSAPWAEQILQAITECRVLVVLLSAHANSSPHVSREVSLALDRGKHVLPVRLGPVEASGVLEYMLSLVQHVDAFPGSLRTHLPTVLAHLNSLLAGPAAPAVARQVAPARLRRPRSMVVIAVVGLVIVAIGGLLISSGGLGPAATPAPTGRPPVISGGQGLVTFDVGASACAASRNCFIFLLDAVTDPDGDKVTLDSVGPSREGATVVLGSHDGQPVARWQAPAGFSASSDEFAFSVTDGHGNVARGLCRVENIPLP